MKEKIKNLLSKFSFQTGVWILALCVPFYILSFVQMAFPISVEAKGILWVVFFGLAKTFQYGGLTIIGVDGWKRIKEYISKKKTSGNE